MTLNRENILSIKTILERSEIKIPSLEDDLLDHLCCVVESKMSKGLTFDNSLLQAISELAPNGLKEIENQTIFLLNAKKIMIMKKFMLSVGLLSLVTTCVGLMLRLLHFDAASAINITTTGLVIFGLVFLPMVGINYLKEKINSRLNEKVRLIIGIFSLMIISIGVTFKMLHLFGANELLLVGIALLTFGVLPFLFFNYYKRA